MSKYKELIERYPYLFSTNEMEPIVLFGVECSEGWYNIIEAVCENLSRKYRATLRSVKYFEDIVENKKFDKHFSEEEAKKNLDNCFKKLKEDEEALPKFQQIKSKFASLRIYTDITNDYISGVIDMAESLSLITCEVCGSHGKTYTIGWHTTLCPEHARERYGEKVVDIPSNS